MWSGGSLMRTVTDLGTRGTVPKKFPCFFCDPVGAGKSPRQGPRRVRAAASVGDDSLREPPCQALAVH